MHPSDLAKTKRRKTSKEERTTRCYGHGAGSFPPKWAVTIQGSKRGRYIYKKGLPHSKEGRLLFMEFVQGMGRASTLSIYQDIRHAQPTRACTTNALQPAIQFQDDGFHISSCVATIL